MPCNRLCPKLMTAGAVILSMALMLAGIRSDVMNLIAAPMVDSVITSTIFVCTKFFLLSESGHSGGKLSRPYLSILQILFSFAGQKAISNEQCGGDFSISALP